MKRRPGLTLVELLVVLAILAVMTTVAMTLTDSLVDQGRFDATRRTIENLQAGVMGSAGTLDDGDGAGFVADMGRVPLAVGADPATQLKELWEAPTDPALLYGLRMAAGDADVKLFAGWRGPYLRLAPVASGPAELRDGWGNRFTLLRPDLTPATSGDPIILVQSTGGSQEPFNVSQQSPSPWTRVTGVVNGSVRDHAPETPADNDEPANPVVVKLYYALPAGIVEAARLSPPQGRMVTPMSSPTSRSGALRCGRIRTA